MLGEADLAAAAHLAQRVAGAAAARIGGSRPSRVTTKADVTDLATDVDVAVERQITGEILERFPGHRVIGEELGACGAAAGAPTWYLDPLDGTTNFAAGIGWCSVSLALADDEGPLLGVVADVHRGQVFSGVRGQGATVDGVPLRCSPVSSLAGTVVMTELSGAVPWPGMLEMLTRLAARGCTVRVMGSSALSLVTAAAGRACGAVIGSYHDVDDLAGVLIAGEAGAVVRARDGGVLVAGPGVADELDRCWQGQPPSRSTSRSR